MPLPSSHELRARFGKLHSRAPFWSLRYHSEARESLAVRRDAVEPKQALAALDTGVCVNNLWYLNYSDRAAGRMTGMTRFTL